MQKEKLRVLASERNNPCVTISMNTHRNHPENRKDVVMLKKLLKEAQDRVMNEFDKDSVEDLLENYTLKNVVYQINRRSP